MQRPVLNSEFSNLLNGSIQYLIEQRPVLNVECSNLLNESIQYLEDLGNGAMQDKINNGETLRLSKISFYDVDRAYENNPWNVALCALHYLRSINKFVSYTLLVVTVVKIPNFELFNLFSFTTLGYSVYAFYFVSALCNHLELYICKHIYNKSSSRHIIEFHNRDVEHINKCFDYMSADPYNEINDILSLYVSKFTELFKYPNIVYLIGFTDIIEKQVEEALVTDLSNGGMANLQSDLSQFSIFPSSNDGDNNVLLALTLQSAVMRMEDAMAYCVRQMKQNRPLDRATAISNCLFHDVMMITCIVFCNTTVLTVLTCLFYLVKNILFIETIESLLENLYLRTSITCACKNAKSNLYVYRAI